MNNDVLRTVAKGCVIYGIYAVMAGVVLHFGRDTVLAIIDWLAEKGVVFGIIVILTGLFAGFIWALNSLAQRLRKHQ